MSAALPRGAPLSTHFATIATSAALKDGSSLYFWIPMFFSRYHGGMTPACGPIPVRCLIARAQGRTHLSVHASLTGASFYERQGYRRTGDVLAGTAGPQVGMQKRLD